MKKPFSLMPVLLLLISGLCINCGSKKAEEPPGPEKIVFHASPDLYELCSEWAAVFCKLNPEENIEVIKSTEANIAASLDKPAQLSFVTGDFETEIYERSLWKFTIGRDIIVPVINAENPRIQEICTQGVSPSGLARILKSKEKTTWNKLIENGPDIPVNLYATNKHSLQSGIARFLETDQFSFDEMNLSDPQELLASVQEDKYGIGICYLLDIIDPRSKQILDHIQILPIDRNGNGYIDYKEDVYGSMDAFARGVWIGKYPKNLASNIYTVGSAPPSKESELDFLSWIVTRGHVLLDNHGFGNLPEFERMAQARIIDGIRDGRPAPGVYTLPKEPGFFTGPLPYILGFLLILTLMLYFGIRMRNRRLTEISDMESVIPGLAFSEIQLEVAPGLYYDRTHTWAYLEKDGTVKVGIDDFLQRVTGPLTRVKMKSPGERVKKGKKAVSIIQDGKQLDICAPVSGTIRELNTRLTNDSSILNTSPYAEGWIYKIEPANWFQEVQFLIMAKSYKSWLKKEYQRLKDFLTETIRAENQGYAHVLQDGGEVKEHILKDLGPELWEDFQTNFMDVSQ